MQQHDLRSVWAAWRQASPVVLDVPADIRYRLLQRYVDMSLRNGRLGVVSFALMLFGVAYEAPLVPRLVALVALWGILVVRGWLSRRLLARMDLSNPRSDPLHDVLVIAASLCWGLAPYALEGVIAPFNLYAVIYGAFIALAVLSVSYLSAYPASVMFVLISVSPLILFMFLQGTREFIVMAVATILCGFVLVARLKVAHATLLQALAAERENALLVEELQSYRRALETENASLGTSLRDASHAATHDPLTGLFNRRHLVSVVYPLAELVHGKREEVTVCMVDVDRFKRVNDSHGHPVGDEVLRSVAGLLGTRLREGDCLARYGGEEFLVILRRCNVARGRRVAEVLRHNVAHAQIVTHAGAVPVTVSLGVAQWAADESFDEVVQRADRALYDAKQSGRDRVEVHTADQGRLLTQTPDSTAPGALA